ncbi:hypothetical protein [Desulfosporosinus fructosivorans]
MISIKDSSEYLLALESVSKGIEYIKEHTISKIRGDFEQNKIEFYLHQKDLGLRINNISDSFTGIYFFEADFSQLLNNWLREFPELQVQESKTRDLFIKKLKDIWIKSKKGNTPQLSAPRVIRHYCLRPYDNKFNNWVPLYVGKAHYENGSGSDCGIRFRVKEHVFGTTTNTTFSMKLMDKQIPFNDVKFRVSYSFLPEFNNDTLYNLVTLFEKQIRKEYLPIVGKQ